MVDPSGELPNHGPALAPDRLVLEGLHPEVHQERPQPASFAYDRERLWTDPMARFSPRLLALVLLASPAHACPPGDYDKTEPRAIGDLVDRGKERFEWSTDVDRLGSHMRISHYVANRHQSNALMAIWQKANIIVPPDAPLPPGGCARNHFPVREHDTNPDYNAPIVYTINGQQQRAAVYVERPSPGTGGDGVLSSVLETSYLHSEAQVRDVRVEVLAERVPDGVRIEIRAEPGGLRVGLSLLPKALRRDDLERIAASYKERGGSVDVANLITYAPTSSTEKFSTAAMEEFVFFSGLARASFNIGADAVSQRTGTVVILDERRRPVMQGRVSLLLPAR